MTGQGYEELKNLNNKIDELIQRYSTLKEENKNLKALNESLEKLLRERETVIKELEKKYEIIKLTGALLGEGEYGVEAKKKISELVREIYKCIALLDR
ncbi:MAG: hypothetical protein ACUVTX_03260 [Bacteroidales bacterium]